MNRNHARPRRPLWRNPALLATVVGEAGVVILFVAVAILVMSLR